MGERVGGWVGGWIAEPEQSKKHLFDLLGGDLPIQHGEAAFYLVPLYDNINLKALSTSNLSKY
jgi:hypothetical protein